MRDSSSGKSLVLPPTHFTTGAATTGTTASRRSARLLRGAMPRSSANTYMWASFYIIGLDKHFIGSGARWVGDSVRFMIRNILIVMALVAIPLAAHAQPAWDSRGWEM